MNRQWLTFSGHPVCQRKKQETTVGHSTYAGSIRSASNLRYVRPAFVTGDRSVAVRTGSRAVRITG